MAKSPYNYGSDKSPTIDGGLGLVIRLNILFNKAYRAALAGDFEDWDHVLDMVFTNLCYREPMDIDFKDGKLNKCELLEEDTAVFFDYRRKIRDVLKKKRIALLKKDRNALELAKDEHYMLLISKDIWLKKMMNDLGLYVKEISFNPATALFGG